MNFELVANVDAPEYSKYNVFQVVFLGCVKAISGETQARGASLNSRYAVIWGGVLNLTKIFN